MDKRIIAGLGGIFLVALLAYFFWPANQDQSSTAAVEVVPAGSLTKAQLDRLAIKTQPAQAAGALPLGTVPGVVTLPPEARVAVTSPFAGAAIRVYVMEGQQVSRGQALALVHAAEPVQLGGELARSRAELSVAEARATRLGQLAKEGIIAGARADEAEAQLRQVRASISEYQRILAMGGASANGNVTLRAPISGRLASVTVQTGGPVDGMTAPFVVENSSAFQLDLQLPARLANTVRPGMMVEVVLPNSAVGMEPVILTGRILSVGASLDPMTRSIMAKASISAAPGLVPGQGVTAIIKGVGDAQGGEAQGVSVPAQSVTRIGGKDCVFVQEKGRFVRREITVIAGAGGQSIIGAGLKPGEQVAISGIAELKQMLAE